MKKILLLAVAIVALSLVGCTDSKKDFYKAEGERLARQLDSLCTASDTVGVFAIDDSISRVEQEIREAGDTAAIKAFIEVLKEARLKAVPFMTKVKVEQGADREETLQGVIDQALNGDVDITTVTRSIDAVGTKKAERHKPQK